MKTTLSVKDFAIIKNLLDEKIVKIKKDTVRYVAEARGVNISGIDPSVLMGDLRVQQTLMLNLEYQDLKHLSQAIGELQVAVQTPDVEVKEVET